MTGPNSATVLGSRAPTITDAAAIGTSPEPRSFRHGGSVPADRSSAHIAIFGIPAWTGILGFAPPQARFKRSAILPRYGEISWSMTTGATRRIRTSLPPCLSKPPGTTRTIRWPKSIG
jgi:hypothetical protein